MEKRKTLSRFPLSHSSYHQQSGKHQPGHEWKGSTWSFSRPNRQSLTANRYFLIGILGAASGGIMIAVRRPFWMGSFV
jgi:hypothetical protein